MATFNFSALSNGQAISFNPNTDVLNFDQTAISASNLTIDLQGSDTHVTVLSGTDAGKSITLLSTMPPQLAASNVHFANGSGIFFGDNSPGTAGDDAANSIDGTNGADLIKGFGGNDTIFANSGNDRIESGAGNDTISGGSGQDQYVWHEFGAANADTVLNFDTGWDSIQLDAAAFTQIGASGQFAANDVRFYAAPGANAGHDADDRIIYNTTTGQLWYDADGNGPGAAQLIATLPAGATVVASDINVFGNAAPPPPPPGVINGTPGDDSLTGTPGNDTINGLGGNDTINGLEGNDSLDGGDGNDLIIGGLGLDILVGGAGNDTLDGTSVAPGGRGDAREADTLSGGLGDDLYIVGANDVILADPGGVDTVRAIDTDWTLGDGLENLTLLQSQFGSGHQNGTGNNLDNVIDASGLDFGGTLNGLGGNDTLLGGHDAAMFGGDGNDLLSAVGLAQTMDGGAGNDTLTGGGMDVVYIFDAQPGAANADLVTNFGSGAHFIQLDARVMGALGPSGTFSTNDSRFYAAPGASSGHDSDDRVVYDTSTGNLWYDADGVGNGAAQLIATLQGAPALAATDITVLNGSSGSTINGTSGNDTLVGGPGNDTINGLAGDDSLSGLDGNDSLIGGDGNDTLDGGAGTNTLEGGLGNDTYLVGPNGSNVINDAGGNDTEIFSDLASARLASGIENLVMQGTTSNPSPFAFGNELDNHLDLHLFGRGLEVDGGAGNDTIVGTNQGDVFEFVTSSTMPGYAPDYGHDVVDGGGGIDTLIVGGGSAVTVDFRAGTVTGGGATSASSVSFTNIEQAFGGGFNDLLIADDAGRKLAGQEGDDTLIGGAGNDILGGDDTFDFPREPLGNDSLVGNGGNDLLSGGRGNDTLDGGTGNDTLIGGNDADIFRFSVAPGTANADRITDFFSGTDAIHLDATVMPALGTSGAFAPGDARFYAAAGATGGHDADDRVIYDTSTGNLYYDADGSGAGAAQLIATLAPTGGTPASLAATDIVVDNGTAGPQPINGTAGNDVLTGTDGPDTINGLAGDDTLIGLGGNDRLDGGDGNDQIDGGSGDDLEIGGAGNDVLGSSDYSHSLFADADPGSDTLDGGLGNDTFFAQSTDTLIDAGGTDTVMVQGISWTLAPGFENLTFYNHLNDNGFKGLSGTGNDLDNVINGLQGADGLVMHGLGGNDSLVGTAYTDLFDGGTGNDTLDGSYFDNSQPDTYLFSAAPGTANADIVTHFATGADKIELDGNVHANIGGSGNFASEDARFYAAAGANGGHDADDRVVYNTTTGQLWYDADGNGAGAAQLIATLQGAPSLVATDITVINGTSSGGGGGNPPPPPPGSIVGTEGNDDIGGTTGNDTIYGMGGNDFLAGSDGADSIVGGAGNDTIFGDSGNDWLEGNAGNDQISGGGGQDSIVFREFGAANADTVANFSGGWDNLRFDHNGFTQIGAVGQFASGDARFFAAAGATGGHDADDRIIYNTTTGQLYYDADGSGAGAAQLVATLQGAPGVAATDVWVI